MGTMQRAARAPLARYRGSFSGGRTEGLARRSVLALAGVLIVWQQRQQDRDILREMNDTQLKDIGIRRADALAEAHKPFWRA